jgi:hypothetical protein
MTITPGNLSLILSIVSSIAPGTWALVAGIIGLLCGFFGKQILKRYDSATRTNHPKPASALPRRNAASRTPSAGKRKKSTPSSSD